MKELFIIQNRLKELIEIIKIIRDEIDIYELAINELQKSIDNSVNAINDLAKVKCKNKRIENLINGKISVN